MSLDDTIELLSAHPMFEALPPDAIRILAFSSDRIDLPAGSRLFSQGAPADAAFMLVSGHLDLELNAGNTTKTVATVPELALLGELALLCQTTRPATAIARTPVELLKIPRTSFRRVLEEFPEGAVELRNRLATRLQAFTGELDGVRVRYLEEPEEGGPFAFSSETER